MITNTKRLPAGDVLNITGHLHVASSTHIINETLSHASAKKESENNRPVAQGTVTELHSAAH